MTSIPSLNVTPRTSFGNWLWPSRRRQLFCAPSSNLKTIASAVLFDRQPFDRIVRWRTVAGAFNGIGGPQVFPVLGREVVEPNSVSRSLLKQSAIQISCNARLAFGC